MGYTHYIHRNAGEEIESSQWEELKQKTIKLAEAVMAKGVVLSTRSEDPWSLTVITNPLELVAPFERDGQKIEAINVNGDYRTGEEHATLFIPRVALDGYSFCKTARKPYNVLVGAILIVANNILGSSFELSSDGNSNEKEWIDSLALVNEVFPSANYQLALPDEQYGNEDQQYENEYC